MSNYYLETLSFNVKRYQDVVTAINFMRSKDTAITVKRCVEHGEEATLRFAFREDESRMISKGCSLREVETLFKGCDLKTIRLMPCVENPDDLSVAASVEANQDNKLLFRVSDIKPKTGFQRTRNPFEGFVGLDDQIDELKGIASVIKAYGWQKDGGANLLLVGNPGTGKTSLAEDFATYLKINGIISGPFHQVSALNLIGVYAGSTPSIVSQEFSKAQNGVLFIDEAYALTPRNENDNPHGHEAINTINELMERYREDVLVICAGYPDEMERFLQANSGLRGRFNYRVDFPDYSSDNLVDVFIAMSRAKGFELEDSARAYLLGVCDEMRGTRGFANARSMRDLLGQVATVMATQFGAGWTIRTDAIRIAYEKSKSNLVASSPIGFFS